ncbi:BnaC06g26650D [Brassica napus]|uniref:BnaC06g26650D protein n=1 Tax=Brassica napus TaxID=3708 RepID=A0A078GUU6_BRANA|nr:BnaC06g26650D [Brassica napus]
MVFFNILLMNFRHISKFQCEIISMAISWTEEERKRATELPLRLGYHHSMEPAYETMIVPQPRGFIFDLQILMLQMLREAFTLRFMRDGLQHLASKEKKKKRRCEIFLSLFFDLCNFSRFLSYMEHIICKPLHLLSKRDICLQAFSLSSAGISTSNASGSSLRRSSRRKLVGSVEPLHRAVRGEPR